MRFFPEDAHLQLEFDKVKTLLAQHCLTAYAREKATDLRIHTHKDYIQRELRQSHEFHQIKINSIIFPSDFIDNISKELKLLSIPGAVLSGEQFILIRKLSENTERIFRWFDQERRQAYGGLTTVITHTHYEKKIIEQIDEIIDPTGHVLDTASEDLKEIRMQLYRKRTELRRQFERIVSRLNKQGYLAEIEESFLNGRRVLAVYAEQKRTVKGILHGESDSRKTAFIEPEETIGLNNDVFALETEEQKEVYRILRQLTQKLAAYHHLLQEWYLIAGEYDFIAAKAKLAQDMQGEYPTVNDKALIDLTDAYHPLLLLYNKKTHKPTIPVSITLDEEQRILVISGPNAGGKTVTMKTIGLLQLMVQSGLLVPVHPSSRFGIFKQLMIHIGDTQSIEFELSTYSSHLLHMKSFIENANGKTLFFIDELGSGTDPNLGGAFAEVIMQELAHKRSFGVVTTHYLNLKVMAGKTKGIVNGAMAFDEQNLEPMYRLIIGKPGSSYTFSIAERIGLNKKLIERAKQLVNQDQYRLDKLLNHTEQNLQQVEKREKELQRLLLQNEKLKKEMEVVMDKEKHKRQIELLREQNKISTDRLNYLKDLERKLKQMTIEWKKTEDKDRVVKHIDAILFSRTDKQQAGKVQRKINAKYTEVKDEVAVGAKVKLKKNHQIGTVTEIRGKRAVVMIRSLPMQVELIDLVVVNEKPLEE